MSQKYKIIANTYTQILIQYIFAVKGRQNLITEKHRDSLEKYICGIITNKRSKPLAIYCNPDHCHVLIGLHPSVSISKMAQEVKSGSSKWINKRKLGGKFAWQEGYGAFTYASSQMHNVVEYIRNQPKHHRKTTFREEYIKFLQKFQIEYDDKYVFKFIE